MLKEIRYAIRTLARTPGFTAIAALSLALGIGANAAIFSLADAILLRPLPVADPGAVVSIGLDRPNAPVGDLSYPDYRDLRDRSRSFDGIVAFQLSTFSLARTNSEVPQMRMGVMVSDNFFHTFGVQPAVGRSFLPEESTVSGASPVVVLSHDFWRDQFGEDAAAIGRTVRVNGTDFNIIGVAPESFTGTDQYLRPSFYVPLTMAQRLVAAPQDPLEDRNAYSFTVDGRLKRGVSRQAAQAELSTIWKTLQEEYPAPGRSRTMAVRTQLQARIEQQPYDSILAAMLMALVSIVLIIACANVANLLLGRARGRQREIAVRIALGVSRARLLRQLFTENVLLALLGAVFGLGLAYGGIRFLDTFKIPTDLPIVIAPQLNQRVFIFSLIAAAFSALVFGLAPAFQSLKSDLVSALKNSDLSSSGRKRTIGRNTLVVAQIALSVVLLVAAGMLLDGFHRTLVANPGFRTDHLMMMEFDTSLVRYTPEQSKAFYRDLVDRARALPGVRSVALTQAVPFAPNQSSRPIIPEGYQLPKGQENIQIFTDVVDEHYLDAIKIEIVSGRGFTADDKVDSPRVAIVNQEFAKQIWPNQEPIGKRLHLKDDKGPWIQVVGVAKNSKYTFIGEPQLRYLYLPFAQEPSTQMVLVAETQGDPATLAAPLREIVHSLDANQPIYNVRTFSNFYQLRAIAPPRMIMQMVATMGLMGLTLALIGIYGLVSYSVARRTREIGVRIAIGADKVDVLKMVLRQGFVLSLIGIGAGGLVSVAVTRLFTAGMFGLATPNKVTFIVVPLTVLIVTVAACWAPAWRASRVDPIKALRFE